MEDDTFYELILGTFILFTAAFYIFPSVTFFSTWFAIIALGGVIYFFKGFVYFIAGKGTERMLMGVAVIVFLMLMFPNGTSVVQNILNLFF